MQTRSLLTKVLLASLLTSAALRPVVGQDADEKSLRKALQDSAEGIDVWIYNDLSAAFKEARKTNKPLFATFRCVPCKDCKGFDAEVAGGNEEIQAFVKNQFVSVRQVEMKGVDLTQFQFDYDLNWAAMFLNADGTVYARYGTQSAQGADAYNSIDGLKQTIQRVLKLHANYPANKAEFMGKRGKKKPIESAIDLPHLHQPEKLSQTTTRNNCIHCHMLHDSENTTAQESKQSNRDFLWRYPLPENIGLTVDPISGRKINTVIPDSAADNAGTRSGSELTHVNGQVITSIADIQWVLHNLPNNDQTISVKTDRGDFSFKVQAGWKKTDISWRGSLWSVSPIMRVWMPTLTDERREKLGLSSEVEGLEVRWINGGKPGGRAARKAGLRQGDVVVAVDGKPMARTNHAKFNMFLKMNYKVGDALPVAVLRSGKRIDLKIKLVE